MATSVPDFPRFARALVAASLLGALAGCGSGGSGGAAVSTPPVAGGGTAPPATVPTAAREIWTPYVIPETRTEPVLYEVVVTGKPATVTLTTDAGVIALHDDGSGGDKVAADGTWTAQVPAATIFARNRPERVNRPYIGGLRLDGAPATYNVFAEVWTAAIGTRPATVFAGGAETDYVVAYLATPQQMSNFDPAAWARIFYATHPDQFDFLNFVLVGGMRDNRHHSVVKNTVSGIGLGPLDNSASFGSAGKLIGISVFPLSALFDGGGKGFLHETGHQWINYLPIAPFAGASPHWPKGNVAINVMGFSIPPSGQGGEFLYSFSPDGKGGYLTGPANPDDETSFNLLELYMMGLAGADEVPDYFALRNQNQELVPGQLLGPGDITMIRMPDVVAAAGPRAPAVAASQKDFRSATIILSERPLDAYALGLYDYFARRGEARAELDCAEGLVTMRCKPWYVATRGRSTMSTRIR